MSSTTILQAQRHRPAPSPDGKPGARTLHIGEQAWHYDKAARWEDASGSSRSFSCVDAAARPCALKEVFLQAPRSSAKVRFDPPGLSTLENFEREVGILHASRTGVAAGLMFDAAGHVKRGYIVQPTGTQTLRKASARLNAEQRHETAALLLPGLARELAALHAQNVVHNAVTIDSVTVDTAKSKARLGDFRLAFRPGVDAAPGETGHAAPDLVYHRGAIGAATDVFGFGLLTMELLLGYDPLRRLKTALQSDATDKVKRTAWRVFDAARCGRAFSPADVALLSTDAVIDVRRAWEQLRAWHKPFLPIFVGALQPEPRYRESMAEIAGKFPEATEAASHARDGGASIPARAWSRLVQLADLIKSALRSHPALARVALYIARLVGVACVAGVILVVTGVSQFGDLIARLLQTPRRHT